MRSPLRAILVGGLGFAVALIVAACGGGAGLLSSTQSDAINGQLSQISSALQAGDCASVSRETVSLARSVAQLPATINPTLRQNLDQGVSTVGQLANQECKPASTTTTSTSSTSTSSTSTSTTSSTPTTTTTAPATTTTTTATTPPATTPATPGTTSTGSGGAGLGGGNSQGGGGTSPGPAGAVAPGSPSGASGDKSNGGKGK